MYHASGYEIAWLQCHGLHSSCFSRAARQLQGILDVPPAQRHDNGDVVCRRTPTATAPWTFQSSWLRCQNTQNLEHIKRIHDHDIVIHQCSTRPTHSLRHSLCHVPRCRNAVWYRSRRFKVYVHDQQTTRVWPMRPVEKEIWAPHFIFGFIRCYSCTS